MKTGVEKITITSEQMQNVLIHTILFLQEIKKTTEMPEKEMKELEEDILILHCIGTYIRKNMKDDETYSFAKVSLN